MLNGDSMDNLFDASNDTYDFRASNGLKASEGRTRLKNVISGVAQPVDRQDSLMLCQQLQEQDGFDFMDENMDLTPYLNDLRGMDDTNEDLESVADKQRVLENDIQMHHPDYAGTPQYADLTTIADAMRSEAGVDETLITVPQTSGFAAKFPSLKDESSSEEERKEAKEAKPAASVKKEASEQIEISFTPTIKPRKYSLKPEAEKKSPLYRLKREKNNDAVRRSRTKAKQQQKMKDDQIKQLQGQVTEFDKILSNKNAHIVHLENAIRKMEEEKRNLQAENTRIKNELFQMKRRCRCSLRVSAS